MFYCSGCVQSYTPEIEMDDDTSRVAFNVFLEEQSVTKLKSKMDCECGNVKCNCLKVCDCKLPQEVGGPPGQNLIQTAAAAGPSAELATGTKPMAADTPSKPHGK